MVFQLKMTIIILVRDVRVIDAFEKAEKLKIKKPREGEVR
jgi:hypothetical protein